MDGASDPWAAVGDPVDNSAAPAPASAPVQSDPYASVGAPVDQSASAQPADSATQQLSRQAPIIISAIRAHPQSQEVNPTTTVAGFDGEVAPDQSYHSSLSDADKQEYASFFKDPAKPPSAAALQMWYHQKTGALLANAQQIVDVYKKTGKFSTQQYFSTPTVKQNAGAAFTAHAANAAAFDWGPELSATWDTLGLGGSDHPSIWNSDSSLSNIWGNNADIERAQLDQDSAQHPLASVGGELTGAALSSPVVGAAADAAGAENFAQKVGEFNRNLIQGSAEGAVFGAGAGGPGNRASGAAIGAATVPLVSSVAKLPFAAAGAGKSVLQSAPGVARRIISKAIADDMNTPESVGQAITEANANGVPMALGDTGENVRGLLAASTRASGIGRTIARDALEERQGGLADRVTQAIERDLGPVTNPNQVADDLMTKAQQDAAPAYQNFYSQSAVKSPAIDNLLNRPSMQGAMNKAWRIAAEEGRDPEAMGFQLDQNGNVQMHPVPIETMNNLQAAREAYDEAAAGLEAAQNKVAGGGSADIEGAQAAVEKASANLDDAKAQMAAAPQSGTAVETKTYSPQSLDYIKRGMDDVIENYRDPTTGKLNLDTEGRAINNTLRQYMGVVDKLYPQYAPARDAWAGPVSAINAMNLGRSALNMTGDDLEARIRDLTPFNKTMFAAGVRRAMAELVQSKGDTADVVNALVGTGKKRAMLARVFGNRQQFQRFVNTLAQEREGYRTFKQGLLGSPTATNQMDDAHLEAASMAADFAMGHMAPITAASKAVKFFQGKLGKKAQQDIAALLSNTNPSTIRELAAQLSDEARRRGIRVRKVNAATGAIGNASVGAGGTILAPQQAQ